MKTSGFLIFFSIVILVYSAVNYYIFQRGLSLLPHGNARVFYGIIFIFLAASFILGRFLERVWFSPFSAALTWIGSFWLGAMLYFFLAVLLYDLARLVNSFIPFLPVFITGHPQRLKLLGFALTVALVLAILLAGYLNALSPRVKKLDLVVKGKNITSGSLKIVAVTDIHMGTLIGNGRVGRLVSLINSLHPDVVILGGDMMDEDPGAVIRRNTGEVLRKLHAPMGVLGITGNHEYIGGAEAACHYLQDHGVIMLRDSVVKINGIYFAGREDRDKARFTGKPRKTLKDLLASADPAYPVILLDHQPFNLEDVPPFGVDLQISGHTHHGQLWPLNHITRAIYEVSRGYRQIGNTHFYVSPGFGTWGPPIKTSCRSEVAEITLHFD